MNETQSGMDETQPKLLIHYLSAYYQRLILLNKIVSPSEVKEYFHKKLTSGELKTEHIDVKKYSKEELTEVLEKALASENFSDAELSDAIEYIESNQPKRSIVTLEKPRPIVLMKDSKGGLLIAKITKITVEEHLIKSIEYKRKDRDNSPRLIKNCMNFSKEHLKMHASDNNLNKDKELYEKFLQKQQNKTSDMRQSEEEGIDDLIDILDRYQKGTLKEDSLQKQFPNLDPTLIANVICSRILPEELSNKLLNDFFQSIMNMLVKEPNENPLFLKKFLDYSFSNRQKRGMDLMTNFFHKIKKSSLDNKVFRIMMNSYGLLITAYVYNNKSTRRRFPAMMSYLIKKMQIGWQGIFVLLTTEEITHLTDSLLKPHPQLDLLNKILCGLDELPRYMLEVFAIIQDKSLEFAQPVIDYEKQRKEFNQQLQPKIMKVIENLFSNLENKKTTEKACQIFHEAATWIRIYFLVQDQNKLPNKLQGNLYLRLIELMPINIKDSFLLKKLIFIVLDIAKEIRVANCTMINTMGINLHLSNVLKTLAAISQGQSSKNNTQQSEQFQNITKEMTSAFTKSLTASLLESRRKSTRNMVHIKDFNPVNQKEINTFIKKLAIDNVINFDMLEIILQRIWEYSQSSEQLPNQQKYKFAMFTQSFIEKVYELFQGTSKFFKYTVRILTFLTSIQIGDSNLRIVQKKMTELISGDRPRTDLTTESKTINDSTVVKILSEIKNKSLEDQEQELLTLASKNPKMLYCVLEKMFVEKPIIAINWTAYCLQAKGILNNSDNLMEIILSAEFDEASRKIISCNDFIFLLTQDPNFKARDDKKQSSSPYAIELFRTLYVMIMIAPSENDKEIIREAMAAAQKLCSLSLKGSKALEKQSIKLYGYYSDACEFGSFIKSIGDFRFAILPKKIYELEDQYFSILANLKTLNDTGETNITPPATLKLAANTAISLGKYIDKGSDNEQTKSWFKLLCQLISENKIQMPVLCELMKQVSKWSEDNKIGSAIILLRMLKEESFGYLFFRLAFLSFCIDKSIRENGKDLQAIMKNITLSGGSDYPSTVFFIALMKSSDSIEQLVDARVIKYNFLLKNAGEEVSEIEKMLAPFYQVIIASINRERASLPKGLQPEEEKIYNKHSDRIFYYYQNDSTATSPTTFSEFWQRIKLSWFQHVINDIVPTIPMSDDNQSHVSKLNQMAGLLWQWQGSGNQKAKQLFNSLSAAVLTYCKNFIKHIKSLPLSDPERRKSALILFSFLKKLRLQQLVLDVIRFSLQEEYKQYFDKMVTAKEYDKSFGVSSELFVKLLGNNSQISFEQFMQELRDEKEQAEKICNIYQYCVKIYANRIFSEIKKLLSAAIAIPSIMDSKKREKTQRDICDLFSFLKKIFEDKKLDLQLFCFSKMKSLLVFALNNFIKKYDQDFEDMITMMEYNEHFAVSSDICVDLLLNMGDKPFSKFKKKLEDKAIESPQQQAPSFEKTLFLGCYQYCVQGYVNRLSTEIKHLHFTSRKIEKGCFLFSFVKKIFENEDLQFLRNFCLQTMSSSFASHVFDGGNRNNFLDQMQKIKISKLDFSIEDLTELLSNKPLDKFFLDKKKREPASEKTFANIFFDFFFSLGPSARSGRNPRSNRKEYGALFPPEKPRKSNKIFQPDKGNQSCTFFTGSIPKSPQFFPLVEAEHDSSLAFSNCDKLLVTPIKTRLEALMPH